MPGLELLDVTESNIEEAGFFCAMSKPELPGYQEKLTWLKARFREGLKLKIITRGGRGFIEYIPGEYAWRAIHAPRFMVVHCLWVVGKAQGRGSGAALVDACVQDARAANLRGVAAVTARGRLGLVDTDFFLRLGFHVVDTARSGLDLVALKFGSGPEPKFLAARPPVRPGLTVFSSPQCPYTHQAAEQILSLARGIRVPARSIRLETLDQLRSSAPSAYCSFDVVHGGQVVANLFHHMTPARLRRLVNQA